MHSNKTMTRDPERTIADPKRLVADQQLSIEDKLSLLESWQTDLIELQRATEESMGPANVSPGANAAKLASVTQAIALGPARLASVRTLGGGVICASAVRRGWFVDDAQPGTLSECLSALRGNPIRPECCRAWHPDSPGDVAA